MDVRFEEIVIAAWLHDVGKFAQRASKDELFNKTMEAQYGKLHEGGWYSHAHANYTAGFLEIMKDVLPDNVRPAEVIKLAASHHNPSSYEEWLIAEGDRLSSGSDRANDLKELENEHGRKFYEKPMIQLMSTLLIDGKDKFSQAYCKMEPLEKDAILSTTNVKICKDDYEKLWDKFINDFEKLKGLKYEEFLKSLDSLLQRYWWCIPSSTINDADISLYQHSKTTVAFACALYRFHEKTNTSKEQELHNKIQKKFLFVNGDISGIQKYIFDLNTTEDNAKLLRAKSFQLWALSQILSEYICKQFDLPSANIIMSAGGKFMLLLPSSAKELLPQIQLELESYFLKEFAGKLGFILSTGVEANATDVMQSNMNKLMNDIGYNAECCKQKKMQFAIQKNGAILNELYDELQKYGACNCCSVFPAQSGTNKKCKNCDILSDIGAKLTKASIVSLDSSNLKHFGQMITISTNSEHKYGYTVNEYVPGLPQMYLPYVAPKIQGKNQLKTFEEIANDSNGVKKLAMFKADVDNLGLIFSSSLHERMSLSRYAELSNQMHYFFCEYYAWFVQKHPEYSEKIYTVYSGGDDICVLGSWDTILEFANDFRKQLDLLTNNNPSVTLSAGISLVNPNIPVRTIADLAENCLDNAKSFVCKGCLKNAINIFETTVSWSDYEQCLEEGKKLYDCLTTGKLSLGTVYKLIDFANRAQNVKNGNLRDLLWISNFRYMATRNIKDKETKEWFMEFGNQEKIQKARISVSYALYLNRSKSEE